MTAAKKPKAFAEVRKETAERMADETQETLPCRYCGTATKRDTLSALGARCRDCFDRYCRTGRSELNPAPVYVQDPRFNELREKARAYRETHPNAFAGMAANIRAKVDAQRLPHDASEDDVNAMLQAAGGAR